MEILYGQPLNVLENIVLAKEVSSVIYSLDILSKPFTSIPKGFVQSIVQIIINHHRKLRLFT